MDTHARYLTDGLRQPPDIAGGQIGLEGQPTPLSRCLRQCIKHGLRQAHLLCNRAERINVHLHECHVMKAKAVGKIGLEPCLAVAHQHDVTAACQQCHTVVQPRSRYRIQQADLRLVTNQDRGPRPATLGHKGPEIQRGHKRRLIAQIVLRDQVTFKILGLQVVNHTVK